MGSRVCVVEQVDRRVRICQPVNGWCSIKSSNGDVILTKLDKQDQSAPPSTPKIRQEKENIEHQMSEILKEHKEIKNEFEKQKKGKENKLAEALQKLEQQKKIIDDMNKGSLGDMENQQQKETKRAYRVDDVVSLTKKVGGGFGIVKYYAEEDGLQIVGVQFS